MTVKQLELLHKILLAEVKRAEKSSEKAYQKLMDKLAEAGEKTCVKEDLKEYASHRKALVYSNDVKLLLHDFEFKEW